MLTLFALISATQLVVDPNIIKLLPKEEPATKELLRINEEEGGTHFLNISLRGGKKISRNVVGRNLKITENIYKINTRRIRKNYGNFNKKC